MYSALDELSSYRALTYSFIYFASFLVQSLRPWKIGVLGLSTASLSSFFSACCWVLSGFLLSRTSCYLPKAVSGVSYCSETGVLWQNVMLGHTGGHPIRQKGLRSLPRAPREWELLTCWFLVWEYWIALLFKWKSSCSLTFRWKPAT